MVIAKLPHKTRFCTIFSSDALNNLLFSDDTRTTLLLNIVGNQNPVDIYKATIFETRLDSSIFYQKPVDEVILYNANHDNKRPSTSSVSSVQSDLVQQSRKKLVKKKRVVIGETKEETEVEASGEAICNEAEIHEKDPEAATKKAKLHPLLANNRQGLVLIPISRN